MSSFAPVRWLNKVLRRLVSSPRWLVPEAVVCPSCGGSMKRGCVLVEKIFSVWTSNTYGFIALNFQDLRGNEVRVLRTAQLAYRCDQCASVFITKPETIGTRIPDPD